MEISELFQYDINSPSCLIWKVERFAGNGNRIRKTYHGKIAGSLNKKGYWTVSIGDTKRVYVHRVIWEVINGKIPDDMFIDHINGDKSDNTIENLRLVSNKVNSRNMKLFENNKTGVTGVCKSGRGEYIASWKEGKKRVLKKFSINKYGEEEVFLLACKAREDAITRMNNNGAGYTDRHGKELL